MHISYPRLIGVAKNKSKNPAFKLFMKILSLKNSVGLANHYNFTGYLKCGLQSVISSVICITIY